MSPSQPPAEEDGTVIRPRTGVPDVPSVSPTQETGTEDGLALRVGTRLGEFELTQRIGEGGFSIVYLAWDHSLDRTVALKEYMPSALATRAGTTQVQARSQRHRDTFEAGLKSFINEAKLLAQFDHPSLVKVYRFWEANGTAYMVMPFYEGQTLKDAIRALREPVDEAWLLGLLAPLTEALRVIHAEQCFHRDIAPDNIMLLAGSGKPLLLDFGAARRVIGDMTQALTVILKPGYAPVEQYAEVPSMKQGPWTDVYALAAVVYWAITGKTPPVSVGRMMSDSIVPLAECAAGRYSLSFLQAIDRALAVLPERRTQTIEALRQELGLSWEATQASPAAPAQWQDPQATVIRTPAASGAIPPTMPRAVPSAAAPVGENTPHRRWRAVWGASALGVVLVAAGVWWALPAPQVSPPVVDAKISVTPAPSPAVLSPEPAPAALPVATPAPAPSPAPAPVPEPSPAPAPIQASKPEPTPPHAAPKVVAEKSGAPPESASHKAECARILQQLSLGEGSPELIGRLKSLNCK